MFRISDACKKDTLAIKISTEISLVRKYTILQNQSLHHPETGDFAQFF